MKIKKILQIIVFSIAVIGSITPSQCGLYNPKCPIELNLTGKKVYNKLVK